LVVHVEDCAVARRLRQTDVERFVTVAWADGPMRLFPAGIVVTVSNETGALARVASTLARLDVGIAHLAMPADDTPSALDMRLVIKVKNSTQLDAVLRTLRRTPSVSRAERARSQESMRTA
jgi:GTP pyrophosphokinase